jgi:hypothetical protein
MAGTGPPNLDGRGIPARHGCQDCGSVAVETAALDDEDQHTQSRLSKDLTSYLVSGCPARAATSFVDLCGMHAGRATCTEPKPEHQFCTISAAQDDQSRKHLKAPQISLLRYAVQPR